MKLELRNATYAFADEPDPVLRDVSLPVPSGDVVSVIGPSGAGKTTLLRLAALFDRPDDGAITLDGVDPWGAGDRQRLGLRRRVGIVFQSASLFDASVARNVDAGLRVRSSWRERFAAGARRTIPDLLAPSPDPDDRVLESLSLVGLEDARDRDARSLSGGEAQRVAFARALAYDPDFLVLDEPTSDLDPRNTAILERAIDRARERGLGVLLATHDMHQAERVSDRVGFLLDGELVEVGPPERLFDSPTDARTERFVEGDLLYDEEPSDESASGEARESPPDASS